ncbi:unnamed protein product, partial [Mesorhabditis spiculigera]
MDQNFLKIVSFSWLLSCCLAIVCIQYSPENAFQGHPVNCGDECLFCRWVYVAEDYGTFKQVFGCGCGKQDQTIRNFIENTFHPSNFAFKECTAEEGYAGVTKSYSSIEAAVHSQCCSEMACNKAPNGEKIAELKEAAKKLE